MKPNSEQYLKISVFVITLVMIVLVFAQRKGRVTHRFYPFWTKQARFRNRQYYCSIALSFIHKGFHCVYQMNFWSRSKILGNFCYLFMVFFAWKKKFCVRKSFSWGFILYDFLVCSYISETLFLPFLFVFFYVAKKCFIGEIF